MILVLVQAIKPHIYLPQIWVKGNLFEFKKEEEEENLRIDCKIMVNQPFMHAVSSEVVCGIL